MFEIIADDLEPDMPLTVLNSSGAGEDLSGATVVELVWFKPDGTQVVSTLTAVNAAAGQFELTWASGDTDQTGYHRGRIRATWSGGETQHYPHDGSWIWWGVHASK